MKILDSHIIQYIQQIRQQEEQSIVLIPHVNPDGDAIGAALALYHFFSPEQKCNVVLPSAFPQFLSWMPSANELINAQKNKKMARELIANASLIVIVDHNAADRSGDLEAYIQQSKAQKLMIDHHPEPHYPVDMAYSHIDVSSTSELVYQLIAQTEPQTLNLEIATCIYVGIMTDTSNYMHNVHASTFKAVSVLIDCGIDRQGIYDRVFRSQTENRMRLTAYALYQKTEIIDELGVAIIALSQSDLNQFAYQDGDTEGLSNMPLDIAHVGISILVLEKKDETKLSFRSKSDIAINRLAKLHFNGGGHRNAAGGRIQNMELNLVVAKLKEAIWNDHELIIQAKEYANAHKL